jgi:hypothetical protein
MHGLFKEAMRGTPVSPCERFGGCEHRQKCSEEELACEQFWVYVNASGTRGRIPLKEPVKKFYERIFSEEGEDL